MRAGRLRTGWEGHLLLAYASEAERITGLVSWASDGLEQGEKVLFAELASNARGRATVDMLERNGVPAGAASSAGALEVWTGWRVGEPDALRNVVEAALAAGFPAVRLALPVGAAAPRPIRAVHAEGDGEGVEAALDALCRSGCLSVLCRYDRAGRMGALAEVVGVHSTGLRTTMLTTRPIGDGMALAGEVDISNVDLFAATLGRVTRSAGGVVWLDLADLRFMDVAGCRALARMTRVFRNTGGALFLVDPMPPVAHVLALIGVDRLRGVEIIGR